MMKKTLKKINRIKIITKYLDRNSNSLMLLISNDDFIYTHGSGSVNKLSSELSILMESNSYIEKVIVQAYDKFYQSAKKRAETHILEKKENN